MQTIVYGQIPGQERTAVASILRNFATTETWNELRIAVAYASVAGLMNLLDALDAAKNRPFKSQWLFGLDDYLTQPGALRACLALENSELRTASLSMEGRRFHPKLMLVSQVGKNSRRCLACVGSSNLTIGGMSRNCEAFAAITAVTARETGDLSRTWQSLWDVGRPSAEPEVALYEEEYNRHRQQLAGVDDPSDRARETQAKEAESSILRSDSPALDPSLANTCWIEVGKNTAMGRELEFKAEQALFFDLSPSGGAPQKRTFVVSSGKSLDLRLKYQENEMWRLQMNNGIPEVAIGLRPRDKRTGKLGRSPFVAVFTRANDRDTYFLRFIRDNSAEYADLRRRSARTSGRTTARRYGWCF